VTSPPTRNDHFDPDDSHEPDGSRHPADASGLDDIVVRPPTVADGGALWSLAREAGGLDVNSSYAYLLWCRDFAATSIVAAATAGSGTGGSGTAGSGVAGAGSAGSGAAEALAGFVTGYRRPDDPDTLLVWQVAVHPGARGRGVAGRMLDALVDRLRPAGLARVETSVTPGNEASRQMFASFARRHGATIDETVLFGADAFPDAHEPECLLRIGPF
jgi:L-2,4-diaminobutyric acid acetyltransferase